jgi:hypothetical protein
MGGLSGKQPEGRDNLLSHLAKTLAKKILKKDSWKIPGKDC